MLEIAMPSVTDPTSFGLDDPTKNKKKLEELRTKTVKYVGSVTLGTNENLHVLKYGYEEGGIWT